MSKASNNYWHPPSNGFFYLSVFSVFLLGFFGGFAIKRDFIPLIVWGGGAFTMLAFEKGRLQALWATIQPWKALLGGLLLWAALSALWGAAPLKQFLCFVRFGASFLLAWAVYTKLKDLSPAQRRFLLGLWLVVFCCILAQGWIKIGLYVQAGYAPKDTYFHRNVALLMGLFCPLVYFLWHRRRWFAGYLTAATLPLFLLGPMNSAVVACIAGALCFGAMTWHRSLFFYMLFAALAVLALGLPLFLHYFDAPANLSVFYDRLPGSWQHRLLIWDKVVHLFMDQPINGAGIDGARYFGGKALGAPTLVKYFSQADIIKPDQFLPLHPHQGFLQILLELGVIGLLLVMGFWWLTAKKIIACCPKQAPWMGATFFMLLVPFSTNYGVWASSWVTIWLMAIILWRLVVVATASKS